MRNIYWSRIRTGRFLVILGVMLIYALLLVLDAWRFFSASTRAPYSFLQFGISVFAALLFLSVAVLVWLYARRRLVALFLLCFSSSMMMTFIVQTGAGLGDPFLSMIGGMSSALSLLFFSILLLLFPKTYFSSSIGQPARMARSLRRFVVSGYLPLTAFLCLAVILHLALYSIFPSSNWDLFDFVDYVYYLLVLLAILVTIVDQYRRSTPPRERQQLSLFVGSVILAFAPFLVLTIFPSLLNIILPQRLALLKIPPVDARLSTLTLALFPLALGYSILRYQILIFDRYIRRAASWIVGGVCLAVLTYLVVVFANFFPTSNPFVHGALVGVLMAVLAPWVWWLSQSLTERLFFSEIIHYRRIVNEPRLLGNEVIDLDEAARLLNMAAVSAFETSEVCLFVLDDDTGYYQLYPSLTAEDLDAGVRPRLLRRLVGEEHSFRAGAVFWLKPSDPLIERVTASRLPLLLSELRRPPEETPTGLARYLNIAPPDGEFDPLLAPVRAQGKLIGVLALGERGDRQPYAGPDFEAVDLILGRFSPILETARLYAQAGRRAAILNRLYSVNTLPMSTIQAIEEVAVTYANVAAHAAAAGAEVWLCDGDGDHLRRIAYVDSGPRLLPLETLASLQEADWRPWYYESDSPHPHISPSVEVPPCLPGMPSFPFAWLPLTGQQRRGILVLTYARPHLFSHEEKRMLEMFAGQCATMLDNAQMTLELRAAYERQKELDRLKDQFIMTASHELRTPLTAVLGYIELLKEYHQHLSLETREDFINKAYRGCDELVLMVSNIMDASRVHIDVGYLKLEQVRLACSVAHVVEILDAMSRRDRHSIYVHVPQNIVVLADELRLRQVLLNLISNALKYSPPGTSVEVSGQEAGDVVTVAVRDHGLGVPPEQQAHLFERFVRLDRDMNSPVRGAGLGLYISEQLVTAMGGRIWVESSGVPGEGSLFSFTLRCAPLRVEDASLSRNTQRGLVI